MGKKDPRITQAAEIARDRYRAKKFPGTQIHERALFALIYEAMREVGLGEIMFATCKPVTKRLLRKALSEAPIPGNVIGPRFAAAFDYKKAAANDRD